jgi:hypothetical protein
MKNENILKNRCCILACQETAGQYPDILFVIPNFGRPETQFIKGLFILKGCKGDNSSDNDDNQCDGHGCFSGLLRSRNIAYRPMAAIMIKNDNSMTDISP